MAFRLLPRSMEITRIGPVRRRPTSPGFRSRRDQVSASENREAGTILPGDGPLHTHPSQWAILDTMRRAPLLASLAWGVATAVASVVSWLGVGAVTRAVTAAPEPVIPAAEDRGASPAPGGGAPDRPVGSGEPGRARPPQRRRSSWCALPHQASWCRPLLSRPLVRRRRRRCRRPSPPPSPPGSGPGGDQGRSTRAAASTEIRHADLQQCGRSDDGDLHRARSSSSTARSPMTATRRPPRTRDPRRWRSTSARARKTSS